MTVIGALYIPNESILKLFKSTRVEYNVKQKAKRMLMDILTKNTVDEPSLLMLINNSWWNVEIKNTQGQIIFSKGKLKEHEASDLLNFEMNKIKLRWENIRENVKNAKN